MSESTKNGSVPCGAELGERPRLRGAHHPRRAARQQPRHEHGRQQYRGRQPAGRGSSHVDPPPAHGRERQHADRENGGGRIEQRAGARHDGRGGVPAPHRQQHGEQHHGLHEPAREPAGEAMDPHQREEQRSADPRGGAPGLLLANDPEHQEPGQRHQPDPEPLAERDRVEPVRRRPEQRLISLGIADRLAQLVGQRIVEQRRVLPVTHPELVHERVVGDDIRLQQPRVRDHGGGHARGEGRGALQTAETESNRPLQRGRGDGGRRALPRPGPQPWTWRGAHEPKLRAARRQVAPLRCETRSPLSAHGLLQAGRRRRSASEKNRQLPAAVAGSRSMTPSLRRPQGTRPWG